MIKLFRHPKVSVIAGIVLTIISALLSHHEVSTNNQHINNLEHNIVNSQQQIDNYWQQIQLLERRKDTATLLLLTHHNTPNNTSISNITQHYITKTLNMAQFKNPTTFKLNQLDKAIKAHTKTINQRIDALYLKNISAKDEVMTLNKHNDTIKGLALFFQIFGMILVLSYNVWDYTKRPAR